MEIKTKCLNNLFQNTITFIKKIQFICGTHTCCIFLKILGELDKQAKTSIIRKELTKLSIGSKQNIKNAIPKIPYVDEGLIDSKKFINPVAPLKWIFVRCLK